MIFRENENFVSVLLLNWVRVEENISEVGSLWVKMKHTASDKKNWNQPLLKQNKGGQTMC